MKRSLAIFLIGTIVVLGTSYSQTNPTTEKAIVLTDPIPFVDIPVAQAEIGRVEKEIVSYGEQASKLNKETAEMVAKWTEATTQLPSLKVLFEEARDQRRVLKDYEAKAFDPELQAKIAEQLKKNQTNTEAVSLKIASINREARDFAEKIKTNREAESFALVVVDRKKYRKALLEAAIRKTQKQTEDFAKQMAQFDSFFTSAEAQKLKLNLNL